MNDSLLKRAFPICSTCACLKITRNADGSTVNICGVDKKSCGPWHTSDAEVVDNCPFKLELIVFNGHRNDFIRLYGFSGWVKQRGWRINLKNEEKGSGNA